MITIGELILGAYVYDGTGITVESGESARFLHKDMFTSSTILADLGARGIEWIPTSQKCEVCLDQRSFEWCMYTAQWSHILVNCMQYNAHVIHRMAQVDI